MNGSSNSHLGDGWHNHFRAYGGPGQHKNALGCLEVIQPVKASTLLLGLLTVDTLCGERYV